MAGVDDSLSPGDSPGFLMWRVTLRWQRLMTSVLRPFDLTHVQFVLLASVWWLAQDGGAPSQRQVAQHAGTDVMMTSQVLRTLESRGLVARAADPTDARVRRLSATADGIALALRSIAVVEAADRGFFSGTAEPSAFLGALRDLAGS